MDCPKCGATNLEAGSVVCAYCGATIGVVQVPSKPVSSPAATGGQAQPAPLAQTDASGIAADYLEIFREFERNGGGMAAKWNWYSFIFGCLWYLSKGMWAKALILFVLLAGSEGMIIPLVWVYCGLFGSYDYYLLKTRGKQLW